MLVMSWNSVRVWAGLELQVEEVRVWLECKVKWQNRTGLGLVSERTVAVWKKEIEGRCPHQSADQLNPRRMSVSSSIIHHPLGHRIGKTAEEAEALQSECHAPRMWGAHKEDHEPFTS